MKLYRAFSRERGDDFAVFHDATASLKQCIEFASRLQTRRTTAEVWIDEEVWPTLTLARYCWYRTTGSHEGFGITFQNKRGHRQSHSATVWPEAAVLKSHAAEFASSIEPASDFLLVASPRYSGNYRCEVVVRSRHALLQAEKLRDSTFGGAPEEEIMRHALPIWLERAQNDAKAPSTLPLPFFNLLDPWVGNFIERGEASVFCLDCKQTVSVVHMGMRNERSVGNRGEWTSSWRCPSGHNLYSQDHDVRLILRPK